MSDPKKNVRIISRLDIKSSNLIKGIHLEGLRVIGDPAQFALKYFNENIDELLYMDSVASLYGRNNLSQTVEDVSRKVFLPICVGGGIRSIDDAKKVFDAGADKIALNTMAIKNPELINEISSRYGNQSVIVSVEAKKSDGNKWEAFTDNGREKTGVDVKEWVSQLETLGAGEILVTSIDMEGTKKGFDLELLRVVSEQSRLPIIASGGAGSLMHIDEALKIDGVEAVALASILHYDQISILTIKNYLQATGLFALRNYEKLS